MSEIIPNLYLGSLKIAKDEKFLKEKKIKYILSCGIFSIPKFSIIKQRKELPLKDNHIQDICLYFQDSFDFIRAAL